MHGEISLRGTAIIKLNANKANSVTTVFYFPLEIQLKHSWSGTHV